jgi:hypothetical protein
MTTIVVVRRQRVKQTQWCFWFYVPVYIYRINDCNVCNTQKRQERPNVGKPGTTRIMTASVRHVASGARIRKLHAFLFLLDSVYIAVRQFLSCRNVNTVPQTADIIFNKWN